MFPNNDVKYDANKQRARLHAQRSGTPITWVQAKDDPSAQTLQDRPNITAEKKKWLSYHDKDCGALYGMLPLVKGMPVAFTDHISRRPKMKLLKGKVGKVHSWILDDEEKSTVQEQDRVLTKLPKAVIVHFHGETWHIKGMEEPGMYPIKPTRQQWYLDKNRKKRCCQCTVDSCRWHQRLQ